MNSTSMLSTTSSKTPRRVERGATQRVPGEERGARSGERGAFANIPQSAIRNPKSFCLLTLFRRDIVDLSLQDNFDASVSRCSVPSPLPRFGYFQNVKRGGVTPDGTTIDIPEPELPPVGLSNRIVFV